MRILKLLENLTRPLHIQAYNQKEEYLNKWKEEEQKRISSDNSRIMCLNDLENQKDIIEKLNEEIDSLQPTESKINAILGQKFKQIPNISYKNKRTVNDKDIPITLNQLITPNAYLVKKLRKTIKPKSSTDLSLAFAGADKVARITGYITDMDNFGVIDNFAYPEEVIAKGKDDCESTSMLSVSLYPEIMGFAFGQWDRQNGKIGHSWVIISNNNELWECEVTGLRAKIWKFGTREEYNPQFIVTQDKTFRVRSGVSFGKRVY